MMRTDFIRFSLLHSVSHQQHNHTFDHADRLPSRLTILDTILLGHRVRIVKDLRQQGQS